MSDPESITDILAELPALLRTERFGHELQWLNSVDSTNVEASSWAANAAPEGALIGTDHQTAGRGRHGRTCRDSPGLSLLFSLVLRPSLPPDRLGLIPLAAGLAISEAIEIHTPLSPSLKWPNDVLVDDKKVCGILLEGQLTSENGTKPSMVLGIGLNVNQTEFPPEVGSRATSLALETGQFIPRLPLLADVLSSIEKRYDGLSEDGGVTVLRDFETRMSGLGDEASISLAHSSDPIHGRILGVAVNGALRLETAHGEQVFHAGEITLSGNTGLAG